jgi:twitching motility protein PilT
MNERSDLDALVSELNAAPAAPEAPAIDAAAEAEQLERLRRWLHHVVVRGASDLLLVASAPPALRINGAVVPLDDDPLESDEIARAVVPALAPHARRAYQERGIADSSFRTADLGRFRINRITRWTGGRAIRRLPTVPRLATLNLPPHVESLTRLPRGLVLIGGPTDPARRRCSRRWSTRSTATRAHHHH